MMLKLFDFQCPAGHIFEELVGSERTLRCECGLEAQRIMSPIRCQLEGYSGDFPGAAMKWTREHEKGAKIESEQA